MDLKQLLLTQLNEQTGQVNRLAGLLAARNADEFRVLAEAQSTAMPTVVYHDFGDDSDDYVADGSNVIVDFKEEASLLGLIEEEA